MVVDQLPGYITHYPRLRRRIARRGTDCVWEQFNRHSQDATRLVWPLRRRINISHPLLGLLGDLAKALQTYSTPEPHNRLSRCRGSALCDNHDTEDIFACPSNCYRQSSDAVSDNNEIPRCATSSSSTRTFTNT